MFWLAQPQEFRQYPLTQKLPRQAAQATFQLLQTLMNNYASGFYRQTARHFDPASYYAEPAAIPTDLYTPSHGEEPYLYWEESDVAALSAQISPPPCAAPTAWIYTTSPT